MKRISGLLIIIMPAFAQAVSVEFDASAFFPTHSTTRDIYGKVWPDVGLLVDHMQPFKRVEQLSFFASLDFLFKHGYSLCFHQETNILLIPITAGLKWIQTVSDHIELYAGLAPKYYLMRIKNESCFVPQTSHEHGLGGYATVGLEYYRTEHLFFDFFLSYSYMNFKAPDSTQNPIVIGFRTDVSGINFGGGLGWKF